MDVKERTAEMVNLYGEVCKKSVANKILGCGYKHINTMIGDGRISEACGGRMVDVRSIAEYICQPKQKDHEARVRKLRSKNNTQWEV